MRRLFIQFVAVLALAIAPVVAFASPLVSPIWLSEKLADNNVVIIDLRNKIDNGSYETFLKGHIPGAIHSDYLRDGWRVGRDDVVGLLPDAKQFQSLARRLGVSDNSHVVVVPAGVSSMDFGSAARAYWTFKVFGHNNIAILDGGFAAWLDLDPANIETGASASPAPGNFVARFNPEFYIGTSDVAAFAANPGQALLVDARPDEQFYAGGKHPKAAKAGRIPSAVLMDQEKAYSPQSNRLKSRNELEKLYGNLGDKTIVSYCNTGHWAATNWFVMSEILGQKNVKLYDGSMVEWTANTDLPLDTSGKSNLQKIMDMFSGLLG
jgi:thiosulfate/3-mercaptopyruvate sulfurtransferase